jgi:hypothetical protein
MKDQKAASRRQRKSGIPPETRADTSSWASCCGKGLMPKSQTETLRIMTCSWVTPKTRCCVRSRLETVRAAPWYVRIGDFTGDLGARMTVYVLFGSEKAGRPVRYFIARNNLLAQQLHRPNPETWTKYAFMPMKAVQAHENKWDALFEEQR